MTDFVPNNQKFPLVAININNEFAVPGSADQPYNALYIGHKLSTGTATIDEVTEVLSLGDAAAKFGVGSTAYEFCRGYFAAGSNNPLYVYIIDELDDWKAREVTLTFTGTTISAGVLNLYIAGKKLAISVSSSDTITTIAANIAAMITSDNEFLFSAVAAAGVVTLTSKSKGIFANEFSIQDSVGMSEVLPGGLTLVIAEKTAGEGLPTTFSNAPLDSELQYILWGSTIKENAYINLLLTELGDRDSAVRKLDGYLIASTRGTLAELTTKGKAFNSQYLSLFPIAGNTNNI